MKRWPAASSSTAPSPRTASEISSARRSAWHLVARPGWWGGTGRTRGPAPPRPRARPAPVRRRWQRRGCWSGRTACRRRRWRAAPRPRPRLLRVRRRRGRRRRCTRTAPAGQSVRSTKAPVSTRSRPWHGPFQDGGDQAAGNAGAGGVSAGVQDARGRVGGLEPQRRAALRHRRRSARRTAAARRCPVAASVHRIRTASVSFSPAPAASVSAMWAATESPGAASPGDSTAETPPWA